MPVKRKINTPYLINIRKDLFQSIDVFGFFYETILTNLLQSPLYYT
jgi:hypothetical protein